MIISLSSLLPDDTRFFEKICEKQFILCTYDCPYTKLYWWNKWLMSYNVQYLQRRVNRCLQSEFGWIYPVNNRACLEWFSTGLLISYAPIGWIYVCWRWHRNLQKDYTSTSKKIKMEVIISQRSFLTKREELSFLAVLALPNASIAGLHCTIWSSKVPWEKKVLFMPLLFMFFQKF